MSPQSFMVQLGKATMLVVIGVDAYLIWDFYRWLDTPGQYTIRLLGVGLIILEYAMVSAAVDAADRGERGKALVAGMVAVILFGFGLVTEFGALSTRQSKDGEVRAERIVAFDARTRDATEAQAAVARLTEELDKSGRNLPVAALEIRRDQAIKRRDGFVAAGQEPPPAVESAVARIEAALVVARERDAQAAKLAAARSELDAMGQRPRAHDPQSEAVAAAAAVVGIKIDPADVQHAIGIWFALIVRTVGFVGFWILTPGLKARQAARAAAGEDELRVLAPRNAVYVGPPRENGAMALDVPPVKGVPGRGKLTLGQIEDWLKGGP